MSKWQCEICNSEFDNFQAQGFNNKIYCPLCYYKELYKTTELERERLNNKLNAIRKYLKDNEREYGSLEDNEKIVLGIIEGNDNE